MMKKLEKMVNVDGCGFVEDEERSEEERLMILSVPRTKLVPRLLRLRLRLKGLKAYRLKRIYHLFGRDQIRSNYK